MRSQENKALKLIEEIDWEQLKIQKAELLSLAGSEELDGLLNLIDALQDFAVDELGVPEEDVFNITKE